MVNSKDPHKITDLELQLRQGKITRRDFLRSTAILGLSLGASELIAGCSPNGEQAAPTITPTSNDALRDPLEDLYGIEYVTTTPDGSSLPIVSGQPQAAEQIQPISEEDSRAEWYCGCCRARFRTLEDLKKHAATEHAWRIPNVQRVDQPVYTPYLTEDIGQFDEKNTVFSRSGWDTQFQSQVAEFTAKAPTDNWDRIEGNALVAGAIYVDQTAGSIHPYYPGYFGHIRGVGGLYNWDDPVNPEQYPIEDPASMSERIKYAARFYGADLVGITEINQNWVYSNYYELITGKSGHNRIKYRYAIVMGIEMKWQEINTSPEAEASAATALVYSRMAETASSLAKYIRMLGYPAIPCGNDTTQSVPLAIDAGLGEFGRHGLLMTPEFGPRQRICKVLTDLPLVADKPVDFGIQTFCESCHACASSCPVGAIRRAERTDKQTSISNRPGILRWPVNVTRCYLFWQENGMDCSNCIAACPWALRVQRDWLA